VCDVVGQQLEAQCRADYWPCGEQDRAVKYQREREACRIAYRRILDGADPAIIVGRLAGQVSGIAGNQLRALLGTVEAAQAQERENRAAHAAFVTRARYSVR
jgi:hypothetical protein